MQCQAQRGILEFTFKEHEPGLYMFHAHQSEFTELGWMGMFDVTGDTVMMHEPANSWRSAASVPSRLFWLLVPAAVLAAAIVWLFHANPLQSFNNGAPPVENLTIERTILDHNGLQLLVRAGGSDPMKIAQVQVDDAYWEFAADPGRADCKG